MYSWKTVLITIALLFGLKVWSPYLVENIEWSWFDFLHSTHETEKSDNIVLVNIDEKAIEKYGQYPWPRDIYRDLLLESHYTNTHVINIVFSEPDRFGGDVALAEGLVNRLSVIASAPTSQTTTGSAPYVGTAIVGGGNPQDYIWNFTGITAPIQVLQDNTYGVGVTVSTPPVTGTPNFDGTVRSAPLLVYANEQVYPSITLETLRAYFDQPSYQLRVTEGVGVEWVRMGREKPITTTPTGDVMISYWTEFDSISAADLTTSDLTDKILIWGLTAEGLNNPVSTPMGVKYPHEVQASLLHTVLQGVQIQQSYYLELASLALLLICLLIVLVVVYTLPTAVAGIVSLGIVGLQVGLGYMSFSSYLFLFDTFYSSIASLVVFGHASFNKYYVTFQLKEQIRKQFQKYLSPDMVKQLQDNPELLKLGGDRKELTFMFMDICGFTPISEHYKNNNDPEGLVNLINKYLDTMTKIILQYGGTIDKYMGDCIMAFWNAPLDCEDHPQRAVEAAKEIVEASERLNQEFSEQGLPAIRVGIGINTGECIVGNMGSELRFDYSVIGDAVNLASRLEGQTRNYDGVDVLLSERTYLACSDIEFKRVDKIKVKGKSEEITVFTI